MKQLALMDLLIMGVLILKFLELLMILNNYGAMDQLYNLGVIFVMMHEFLDSPHHYVMDVFNDYVEWTKFTLDIIVEIKEVFLHCPKAFIRSKLWNPESQIDRSTLPSLGKMILEQIKGSDASTEEVSAVDAMLDQDIDENLYHR